MCAVLVIAPLIAGCQTTSGTRDVAVESIKIVCLSRKDTALTKQQVIENNQALRALGAPKPRCKK